MGTKRNLYRSMVVIVTVLVSVSSKAVEPEIKTESARDWKEDLNGQVKWDAMCEFQQHNIGHKTIKEEGQCAGLCLANELCTHFSVIGDNCFFKKINKPVTEIFNEYVARCGFIIKRVVATQANKPQQPPVVVQTSPPTTAAPTKPPTTTPTPTKLSTNKPSTTTLEVKHQEPILEKKNQTGATHPEVKPLKTVPVADQQVVVPPVVAEKKEDAAPVAHEPVVQPEELAPAAHPIKRHWETEFQGRLKWAHDCNFKGESFSMTSASTEECKDLCLGDVRCTHFTWLNDECSLKTLKGDVKEVDEQDQVCGYTIPKKTAEPSKKVSSPHQPQEQKNTLANTLKDRVKNLMQSDLFSNKNKGNPLDFGSSFKKDVKPDLEPMKNRLKEMLQDRLAAEKVNMDPLKNLKKAVESRKAVEAEQERLDKNDNPFGEEDTESSPPFQPSPNLRALKKAMEAAPKEVPIWEQEAFRAMYANAGAANQRAVMGPAATNKKPIEETPMKHPHHQAHVEKRPEPTASPVFPVEDVDPEGMPMESHKEKEMVVPPHKHPAPAAPTTSTTTTTPRPYKKGEVIFKDEFDALDTSIWKHAITGKNGDNTFQFYTTHKENSFVRDGILFIKPTLTADRFDEETVSNGRIDLAEEGCDKETDPGACVISAQGLSATDILNPIASAQLSTEKTFNFTFGSVELRAKMPKGDWISAGISLMPVVPHYGEGPRSGEIDIIGMHSNEQFTCFNHPAGRQVTSASIHLGASPTDFDSPVISVRLNRTVDYSSDFHLYRLDWSPEGLKIFIDGQMTGEVKAPVSRLWQTGRTAHSEGGEAEPWTSGTPMAPFDRPFYFVIDVNVGGSAFPDGCDYRPSKKPWTAGDQDPMRHFWDTKDQWLPSWNMTHDENALQLDYIRVFAL